MFRPGEVAARSAGIAVGSALVGLALGARDLTAWLGNRVSGLPTALETVRMSPAGAAAVVLLGAALIAIAWTSPRSRWRLLARGAVLVVLCVSVLRLSQFSLGLVPRLSRWLFDTSGGSAQMSFVTAFGLVLAAIATDRLASRGHGRALHEARVLGSVVAGAGCLYAVGHLFQAPLVDAPILGMSNLRPMSLNASLGLILLGTAAAALATAAMQCDRAISQALRDVQGGVMAILAEREAPLDALARIAATMGEALNWHGAALWKEDTASATLHCAATWRSPRSRLQVFEPMIQHAIVPAGYGLTGRALEEGSVWTTATSDANGPHADPIALEHGVCTTLGLSLGKEQRWALALYSPEIREPGEGEIQTVATIRHQVGQYLSRKRVEEERDRFFSLSLDMLCVAGVDGQLKRVNPAFERVLGYPAADLQARSILDLVHPDDRAAAAAQLELLQRGEDVLQLESRWVCRDASVRWISLTCPAPPPGDTRVYAVGRDVTESKNAETALRAAKEGAEQASRFKTEFLANVSHEIRNPMNAILGLTDIMLDTPLDAEQRECLQLVRRSGDVLMRLFNDLLDISKIEAGKLELERMDFILSDTVADVLKSFAASSHNQQVELAYHIAKDVPDALLGDVGRLRQVIVNLVGNAIKFTERGEVTTHVEVLARFPTVVALQVTVRDTGPGIPPELLERVFEPFVQGDASVARRFGGTGLGLAISRQLVQLMGGEMRVESTVGQGSVFYFSACFELQRGPQMERVLAPPESLHGLAVLVVDDSPTYRRLLDETLRSWHMRPSVVADGPAGLQALEQAAAQGTPFALAMVDSIMPGMDGFAVCEQVRDRPNDFGAPKLMLLSSTGWRGDAIRCRALGVSAYLHKPVKAHDLLEAVLTVLGLKTVELGQTLVTGHSLRARKSRRVLRVLLADDEAINLRLCTLMLERMGHRVVTAGCGSDVLHRIAEEPFDVVLMDVQMPTMDGLETTARIRASERASGGHLPVVAVSAAATPANREECQQAGVDAFLAKPITAEELYAVLERLLGDADEPPAPPSPAPLTATPGATGSPIDAEQFLVRVQNNPDILSSMVDMYAEQTPILVDEIRQAVRQGDGPRVEALAHRFKGAQGIFGARGAVELAGRLEDLAMANDLHEADGTLQRLADECLRVRSALRDLKASYKGAGVILGRIPAPTSPLHRP